MSVPFHELRPRARKAEHEEGVLAFLRGEVARLARLRDERGRRLATEARDVEELDGFSLAGMLERLLGTRATRFERERREEAAARLAFEEAKGEHARLAERLARLEGGAEERAAALQAFAEASERRAAELRARGGAAARRVAELESRMEARERRLHELGEARALCEEALAELESLRAALADAWGHGAADLFAAGYHAERSAAEGERAALNRAHAHAEAAAVLLARLEGELAGTGVRFEPRFALPEAFSVADWWLDGVLLDWLGLRRTSVARERASEIRDAVQALALRLRHEASALEHELARDRRLLEERLEA